MQIFPVEIKELVDSKWSPCHVFLIFILPEESVVFTQHVVIRFVIGSDRKNKWEGLMGENNAHLL